MFYKWNNECVRLIGRWGVNADKSACCATATGSRFEFAFIGNMVLMHFDMSNCQNPYPHLWVQVDDNIMVETAMDSFLRISTNNGGFHKVCVILKSAVETHHRWHNPLIGKIAFIGFEAQQIGALPTDDLKKIEFIGDSVTEGVLLDEESNNLPVSDGQFRRVYQDDVCATYAWLTAKKLNLQPVFMGYGATGLTKSGNGGVPKAADAYPYAFDGCPINVNADYVLINHGGNDSDTAKYIQEYENLLNQIRRNNQSAVLISVSPFCGKHNDELEKFIADYNERYNENVIFISSKGWIPADPLHPLRDGHIIVSEKLSAELKKYI